MAANALGRMGLVYGVDFMFKTGGSDEVSFDFRDPATKVNAALALTVVMTTR